ncbi:Uncharacterised protein [Klebsiella pneumoniae]|nr:Uncharacterised protein [Klebsiella pneumoniae]
MVTRNQGKPLTALERAAAYQRLRNQGWEPDEIAKKVKRSLSDVDYHLHLLTCGEELISMVRAGEVSPTTAVALSREHGPQAASVAVRQMDKARASGKSKLTRSAALSQFSAAKARQFLQIIADQADIELPADARAILDNYREFLKEAGREKHEHRRNTQVSRRRAGAIQEQPDGKPEIWLHPVVPERSQAVLGKRCVPQNPVGKPAA